MYGVICAMRTDEASELRALCDTAFTTRVFGGKSRSLIEDHERTLHLETLWAAVDFVLTGATVDEQAPSPLNVLRPGGAGEPVGPDLGSGRARLLSPSEVRVLADAVKTLAPDALEARVRSPRLGHVYPFAEPETGTDELLVAATRAVAEASDSSFTAESLVAKLRPSRGERPTAAERDDVREALVELQAFLAKLVRDGAGALVSIA